MICACKICRLHYAALYLKGLYCGLRIPSPLFAFTRKWDITICGMQVNKESDIWITSMGPSIDLCLFHYRQGRGFMVMITYIMYCFRKVVIKSSEHRIDPGVPPYRTSN